MKQKSALDFKRALRAFCAEHDLFIEEKSGNGPNERIVIFERKGQQVKRVASLIVRRDQKEISPGLARAIITRLRQRAATELEDAAVEQAKEALKTLTEWLISWFG